MNHPHLLEFLKLIENEIQGFGFDKAEPEMLYSPIHYTFKAGGKRLRPILLLAACEMFEGDCKNAIKQATAIELFHNFTLIHDDVLDNSEIRRGVETVYKKFGLNAAILTGDLLLIKSYQLLSESDPKVLKDVLGCFNDMTLKVYEGQKYDLDAHGEIGIKINEYIEMVQGKTSVLLAVALKIGAILAGASAHDADLIYTFGLEIGTAFQIKDDLLDVFGNPEVTGKQLGRDIINGKNTWPLIKCLEMGTQADNVELLHYAQSKDEDEQLRLEKVLSFYDKYQIKSHGNDEVNERYHKALNALNHIQVKESKKDFLKNFALYLMQRES